MNSADTGLDPKVIQGLQHQGNPVENVDRGARGQDVGLQQEMFCAKAFVVLRDGDQGPRAVGIGDAQRLGDRHVSRRNDVDAGLSCRAGDQRLSEIFIGHDYLNADS